MKQYTDPDDLEALLAISVVQGLIHRRESMTEPGHFIKCGCTECKAIDIVCDLALHQVELHRVILNKQLTRL